MTHAVNDKSVKNTLNKHFSNVVKSLQVEAKRKGSSVVHSDNADASEFIHVLEAAFVLGLKTNYYEKHKPNKELPKPQFWNLICKISHKDTLEQVRNLSYVRSNVGRCRAWLRLALNESALSSYLTSLFYTPEYVPLLSRYYDDFALFSDNEQRDIFLSYLQGTEQLSFEFGSNSSLLDTWTRTPLELSGIIPQSSTKKASDLNVSHSVPDVREATKKSDSVRCLDSSFQNRNENLVATNVNTEILADYSSYHSSPDHQRPTIKVDGVSEEKGNASVITQPSHQSPSEDPDLLTSVLFERHLNHRRGKRRRRKDDGRLTPQNKCSSSESINSFVSGGSELEVPVSQEIIRSRSSSVRSKDEKTYLNQPISFGSVSSGINSPSTEEVVPDVGGRLSPAVIDDREENSNEQSFFVKNAPTQQNATDVITGGYASESDELTNHSARNESSSRSSVESSHSEDVDGALLTSSSHEDITDIYTEFSTQSHPENHTNGDNATLRSSISGSSVSGHGNSLLCGIGWSSEMDEEQPGVTSSVTSNHTRSGIEDSFQSDVSDRTELRIREGFLQKKGETLVFWRTRWFVLSTSSLSYYKDKSCDVKLGFFHLSDIESISDKNVQKRKIMSLKLVNGDEHQLAAESRQILRDWVDDICQAVKNAKVTVYGFGANLNAVEDSFVMLNTCDVDGEFENNSLPYVTRNTSWHSSMKNHVTRIATEQGLDAQNYQCADCAAPIGILYGIPRVCSFTGQYYCPQCHLNDEHQIPARIVHNWDFKKHKVSKRSKLFLNEIWKDPCIDLDRVNPIAYHHLDELRKLLPLRTKLSLVYPYISTCRKSPTQELVSILRTRYYMMENPHIYSAYDLLKARGKSLLETLKKALSLAIQHVINCELCSSKGFHCEVCQKNEIIFAFQTETTHQCEDCKTVYHKLCLPDISKCRKCDRRNQRMLQSRADDELYDYDSF